MNLGHHFKINTITLDKNLNIIQSVLNMLNKYILKINKLSKNKYVTYVTGKYGKRMINIKTMHIYNCCVDCQLISAKIMRRSS